MIFAPGIIISALLSPAIPASAITFGKEITDASNSYPSVISIWIKESAEEPAQFICTGTLIQDRIVLTAAHCVLDKTFFYYVKYGNDLLDEDSPLLEVASTWRDPRYSERQGVNDVGLLLLTNSISGAKTTALPSAAEIKKILATKGVKLEVVGWGKDQNSAAFAATFGTLKGNKVTTGYSVGMVGTLLAITIESPDGSRWASNWFAIP